MCADNDADRNLAFLSVPLNLASWLWSQFWAQRAFAGDGVEDVATFTLISWVSTSQG